MSEEMMEKNGEDDRISALPDCLLLEVLSRLPFTEEAIRTGTLSKRWQHVWTLVPDLMFVPPFHYTQNPESMSDFGLMVDKTLSQCRQLKLRKFEVYALYDIRYESQYRNWIRLAISCNVEDLNLIFLQEECEFVLDQFLFINSYFTNLRLAYCKLNPTGAISWENLRSLCISWVNVDEELLANIVSGSPLLETLMMEHCKWPHIPSESDSESESELTEISAPTSLSLAQCRPLKKLKKFKLSTDIDIEFHPQINNSICYAIGCNVEELNLQFWHRYEDEFMLDQVLFTTSSLAELRLGGCMLNPVGALSWKSLRFLCLSEYMNLDEELIEKILSGSPVLETLELNNCYGYRRLDITSKSVKNLVLDGYKVPYDEAEDDVIEINAPHILSLTIQCVYVLRKPLLLNVSCVVKAHLSYTCRELEHWGETPKEAEQEMLKGFIVNL